MSRTPSSSASALEIVVVLPYVDGKVLMQLRDFTPGIPFPGHWSFFGGAVEEGEDPKETAVRELFEEVGYRPAVMHSLGVDRVYEQRHFIIHSFFCALTIPVEELKLTEGADLGLFTLGEISTMQLYSAKMKSWIPVTPNPYMVDIIERLFSSLSDVKYSNS